MTLRKEFSVAGAVLVSAVLLVACRAEEQGRVTMYEKGTYLGPKDTEIDEAQRRALRQRTALQGGTVSLGGGGGARSESSDVRPPGRTSPEEHALKARARQQRPD